MALIEQRRFSEAHAYLSELNEVDIADWLSETMDEEDPRILVIFRMLSKEMAAEVFSYLTQNVQQMIVEGLSDKELARVVDDLFLDDTVDFIEEMPATIVKRVLRAANPEVRKQINQLLMYPEESAGSLMTLEYMALDDVWPVRRVIEAIRSQGDDKESIAALYVTDRERHLEGVVSLRDVLTARDDEKVGDLMKTDIISVNTLDGQEEVAARFKRYDLVSMPVVDNEDRLVGIITIDDIVDVIDEETTEDMYKMAAMQPSEDSYLRSSVWTLAKNRIVWLIALMVSATFAGIIISRFDAALEANVLLASFIPMLMDTGGNAGSQSSVSIIRALTLREIRLGNYLTILWKEFRVGLLVSAVVALVNFLRVVIMYGDVLVGLVVSMTLIITIVAAKLVGCSLPLLAEKIGLDPALMASPLLTTIVDAVALIVFFNIAVAVLGL